MSLEKVSIRNQTVWSDFTVLNDSLYTTQVDLTNLNASEDCILTALNFSRYIGYNGSVSYTHLTLPTSHNV